MGIELFERAASGGGQLLRAEVSTLAGSAEHVSALMLTFDLGRITVTADRSSGGLRVVYAASSDNAPSDLHDAGEDEPWWRLLGRPLARVWPAADDPNGALCLQFGTDGDSSRIVSLEPRGAAVAIRLELAQ